MFILLIIAYGGGQLGQFGNKCHVDCSNRGTCDHGTGKCACYDGSYGEACEKIVNSGGNRGLPKDTSEL